MRPGVDITAYQGNVKEARFGVDFFRRFDCVLNGLDNLEARRHVNRLCLAAEVPLVESGTAGFLGQVSVHIKGATECFECQPKPTPKTFPVCTLRNTPDKPIHCIVWAKEMLFPLLFGAPEASDLNETIGAEGSGEDGGEAGQADDPSFYQRREGEGSRQYAERVFRQLYSTKIEELRRMEDLWHSRRPPEPLNLDALLALEANGGSGSAAPAAKGSACKALGLTDAHAVWDVQQNARVFLVAVQAFLDERADELGAAQFDKDDQLAVEFVTAASNLRAACYGIPMQSLFVTKGMAGNIIHAIATTNAIVSGLIVLEALKLLAGAPAACQTSFLHQQVSGSKRLVSRMAAPTSNPACMVCGTAQAGLVVDTHRMTLQQLVDKVLKGRLALLAPSLSCGSFLYEEGQDLEEDEVTFYRSLLPRPLASLPGGGLVNGSIVEVSDQEQQFKAQLVISHREDWDEEVHPEGFELSGSLPAAEAEQQPAAPTATASEPAALPTSAATAAKGPKAELQETADGVVVLTSDDEEAAEAAAATGKGKRKASELAEDDGQDGKRARVQEGTDVVDLLDDSD
ncbi:SUMO-activating enzyme subunit 2 [Chlorella sorokiniana]|uniref:SUMO-activating enzyme subunit n=1 Tax=Chlorella sorokiniana TaxID=3076 RepID=A0A2P6U3Z0_CHLSO|nr:SUMO-activating enzyme subunit 2 [Chlorella sorokiniana]|eukprot:PRW61037.1 SUMO-activating enzyme subunit 2 [Chlorella sorokiniana]